MIALLTLHPAALAVLTPDDVNDLRILMETRLGGVVCEPTYRGDGTVTIEPTHEEEVRELPHPAVRALRGELPAPSSPAVPRG